MSPGTVFEQEFEVTAGDFNNAGKVSRNIKNKLTGLGADNEIIRRIAIASYEAEINVIIHSDGGRIKVRIGPDTVILDITDDGPGIENVELAMTEGWSTASDEIRELGFGAGMGLPNMKMHADDFSLESAAGSGTHITMMFKI